MSFTAIAPYTLEDLGSPISIGITGSSATLVPPITSGMLLWLNPNSPNTIIDTNGNVSQIGDDSGRGQHFSNATAAARPKFNATDPVYGYKSSLTFNNLTELTRSFDLNGANVITIYAVAQRHSLDGNNAIFAAGIGGNARTFNFKFENDYLSFYYANPAATFTNKSSTAASITIGTTYRLASIMQTTSGSTSIPTMSINGINTGTYILTGALSASSFNNAIYGLGSIGSGTSTLSGSIATVLIFSGSHTPSQMAQMDAWLSSSFTTTKVGTFTLSTGSYFTNQSATIEDITYNNLLSEFTTYLSSSGYGTFTGFYDFNEAKVKITGSNYGIKLSFLNDLTRKIFGGISAGTTINQTSYTSSYTPWFHWKSTEEKWSDLSFPYEGKGIVSEEACDDGRVYQISNEDNVAWLSNIPGNYTWQDWKFVFENKNNVFIDFSSSNPYVWQQHLNQVRSYLPFLVYEYSNQLSGTYEQRQGTYKIRANQSKFAPQYSLANYDQCWDIPVKTRRLSLGNNFNTYFAPQVSESFKPSDIDDCLIWLRSDLGIITTSLGLVSQWLDQSGNSNHFINSASINYPEYTSSFATMNNLPVVHFLQGNYMHTSTLSFVQYNSASSATMYIVRRAIETLGSNFWFSTKDDRFLATLGTVQNLERNADLNIATRFKNIFPGTQAFLTSSIDFPYSTNLIQKYDYSFWNATTNTRFLHDMYINGQLIDIGILNDTLSSGSVITNGVTFLNSLGNGTAFGEMPNSYYQELIFFRRELTDIEKSQVESYLRNRYNYY